MKTKDFYKELQAQAQTLADHLMAMELSSIPWQPQDANRVSLLCQYSAVLAGAFDALSKDAQEKINSKAYCWTFQHIPEFARVAGIPAYMAPLLLDIATMTRVGDVTRVVDFTKALKSIEENTKPRTEALTPEQVARQEALTAEFADVFPNNAAYVNELLAALSVAPTTRHYEDVRLLAIKLCAFNY